MKDGLKSGFVGYASTQNTPGGIIVVDFGTPQAMDEIIVWNRDEPLSDSERILGCEILVMDESMNVIKKWAFKDVDDQKAKTEGAHSYRMAVDTNWVMVPRWKHILFSTKKTIFGYNSR